LNHYKKVNKDITHKIGIMSKNVRYEKRKNNNLNGINKMGMRLHGSELNNHRNKKTNAMRQR